MNLEILKVSWKVPSNIAFIKYWGKKPIQLPSNPSLSMTLKHSYTETHLSCLPRDSGDQVLSNNIQFDFLFEGKEDLIFKDKIRKYLNSLNDSFPYLRQYKLRIESRNTFPHSAGIASSASFFASLALCLLDMSQKLNCQHKLDKREYFQQASILARLGSGSACRSLYGDFVLWGEVLIEGTQYSDEYGLPFVDFHSNFKGMKDSILIVDSSSKAVSSSRGHELMRAHPFSEVRFSEAKKNLVTISKALKEGDWESFGEVLENEAMQLHSLMMTSRPSFILMRPQTLELIELIRHHRSTHNLTMYFTLDAGPNLHLIYPESEFSQVDHFISTYCKEYLENSLVLNDEIGSGPTCIGV